MRVKGISSWAWVEQPASMETITNFLHVAKESGFHSVELSIGLKGDLCIHSDLQTCREISRRAAKLELAIASTSSDAYWHRALDAPDKSVRDAAIQDLILLICVTKALGAKTLLTIVDATEAGTFERDPKSQSWIEEGLRQVIPFAEGNEVCLGVENLSHTSLGQLDAMLRFVDRVPSPHVGVYFDIANALPFQDPVKWIHRLGSRIAGVHVKGFRQGDEVPPTFLGLKEGGVDWRSLVQHLNKSKYLGAITAEGLAPCPRDAHTQVATLSKQMDEWPESLND